MKIELTTAGGKFITLNLPKSPSDVPLRKFIDLDVGYNRLIEWVVGEEEEKSLYENRTYYAYKLAKLLSNYFEVDINDLLDLPAEDLLDDTGQLLPGVLKEHISNMQGKKDTVPEVTGTLLSILEYLDHILLKYEPKLIGEFEYKGEKWIVPELRVLASNEIQFPKVTVMQAIEAMEVERAAKHIAKDPEQEGSAILTTMLHRIAILCHKEGEEFNPDNFHNKVSLYVHHFKDITMDIALDILFFSQNILENYIKEIVSTTFSTLYQEEE
ncbi:MAG TPA: hypothetical protein VK031_00510 [Tissierellaceae bacterium]|nr:hypothetical protein [Tissierellaceae bacterium]